MAFAVLPPSTPDVFRIIIVLKEKNAIAKPGIVWQRVERIFSIFCQQGSSKLFSRAEALWVEAPIKPGSLRPFDLVAYLVRDKNTGLVRTRYPAAYPRIRANTVGFTVTINQGLSEIYFGHPLLRGEPKLFANTIIHELMHNKLRMGNEMHDLATQVGAGGGFLQEEIQDETNRIGIPVSDLEPSAMDINVMNPALPRVSPQYEGI
jgi:hypothetical protein